MGEFEIFLSKHNPNHYVAVRAGDFNDNAMRIRDSQNLVTFTVIPDDGRGHVGFDPAAASAAVAAHGFYAFAVLVEERDGLQEFGL